MCIPGNRSQVNKIDIQKSIWGVAVRGMLGVSESSVMVKRRILLYTRQKEYAHLRISKISKPKYNLSRIDSWRAFASWCLYKIQIVLAWDHKYKIIISLKVIFL